MRVMSLDWGEARVGVAISDEEARIAFPYEKVLESKKAVEAIEKLVKKLKIEIIVLGRPISLSGEEGLSVNKVDKFAEQLRKKTKLEIKFLDERFTTMEAGKLLAEQGMNEKKQKAIKDNIAAQIMLQAYLDYKSG